MLYAATIFLSVDRNVSKGDRIGKLKKKILLSFFHSVCNKRLKNSCKGSVKQRLIFLFFYDNYERSDKKIRKLNLIFYN